MVYVCGFCSSKYMNIVHQNNWYWGSTYIEVTSEDWLWHVRVEVGWLIILSWRGADALLYWLLHVAKLYWWRWLLFNYIIWCIFFSQHEHVCLHTYHITTWFTQTLYFGGLICKKQYYDVNNKQSTHIYSIHTIINV